MSSKGKLPIGFRVGGPKCSCNCDGEHYTLISPEELGLTIEQINAMPWDEYHPYYTNPAQPYWYAYVPHGGRLFS